MSNVTPSVPWRRLGAGVGLLALAAALQGCATPQNRDPIEGWNRKVFAFNETVDENVLQPVAKGYNWVTPEPIRLAVRNVFGNIGDVWSTLNLFMQGRFSDGYLGVVRVTVNTTLGLGGLLDVASAMQIERRNEDFGQTLGVWGVKPGAYIVWPFLGASTLRDSVGIPGDLYFSASTLAPTDAMAYELTALRLVSVRANLLGATNLLDDVALDKYAFFRDAYLQRRQNLIYEGNPPEEDEEPDDLEPPAASASASEAASATVPAAQPASSPAAPASAASAP
ncbi:VacJ family lipoprotein [Aquabacterium sp.]|uniref:MlaA family lipoprotein n=1 Tax=Aquabacterium sp. TaxID=1872578 RepID=UPI0025C4B759|nr:VacJ family lipoprotein [Aquabacterium sp.]